MANHKALKEALKSLILINKATLVTALTHQGESRAIEQVTTSNLTPPNGYYYILISVTRSTGQSNPKVVNRQRPSREAQYNVQIEIADEALVQSDDNTADAEMYETMHEDFDLFADRIAALIENQNFIGSSPIRFKLLRLNGEGDRAIARDDLSGTWEDSEGNGWATLYSMLTFTMIDECDDDTALYS